MPRQSSHRGLFITFEGTEGAGKSTLIRFVQQKLQALNLRVCTTREPGGPALSEKIRTLILSESMDPWTELFLYEAARSEHWVRLIEPALQSGEVVLCDRFTDSTLAYQGHARGLSWATILKLNALATRNQFPDLTVFLDIDPAKGLKRAQVLNRFELEGLQFQKKVRQGFLKAKSIRPKRWLHIKAASQPPEVLADQVINALYKKFPKSLRPRK